MGLIDFVKNAGAKIFGGDDDDKAPKPQAQPQISPAEHREKMARHRAAALVAAVEKNGLKIEDLSIRVDDDVATVKGKAPDQATREKAVLVIGNTNGISRVDDQIEVVKAEPEAVYHTVASGDTLSKIAKKHYGNANKYPVIFEANKPMLSDPDKIYPGQVLRIPPQEG